MQLITNRIHIGKSESFDDFVRRYKEAQAPKVVKVAEEKEEGETSGQLKVEPLHQTGESTEMPKKGPSAKKDDDAPKAAAAANTKTEEEGKDSGQPKAEGSEKLTNDPKVEEEQKGGSAKTEVKEAGFMCKDCNKPQFACTCKKDGKEDGKEEKKDEKDASAKTEKQAEANCEKCGKGCGECSCGKCDCKSCKAFSAAKATKKAAEGSKFVKLANLGTKDKKFLKDYWKQLFGEEYANAMISDK